MISEAPTKRCAACGEHKPLTEFHKTAKGKDGLHSYCKRCNIAKSGAWQKANQQKRLQQQRAWKKANKHKEREYYTRYRYGIELELYNAMYKAQRGVCAICRNPPHRSVLCIDHCHETGRVRGLLCNCCNAMLGRLKDDKQALQRAIDYLDKHENRS